jgi:phosphoglycolate phosphatase-like HAD superfamily hydrolase
MNFFQLNGAIENGLGYKVFCDLDGVLVDLERGLANHYGIPTGFSTDKFQKLFDELEESETDLERFFENLHWTKDGKELWKYFCHMNP